MIAFNDHPPSQTANEKWQNHVSLVFCKAILEVHGSMPTDEELSKWCRTLITADGTHHLAWKAPDWGPGETVDMSYVIASVPPPMNLGMELN